MSRCWRRLELAWLSVVVLVFVAVFGATMTSDRFLILHDSWCWALPLRGLAWEELRDGRIPTWTHSLLSGYPLLSMAQLGVGYPMTWGYFFDSVWGEQIYVLAPFVLSPIFTYVYARSVGRSQWASLLAGLSFAYGGAMTSPITHSGMISNGFMWLPLVLACLERARESPFVPCLIGAVGAYSMAVLSGIGQVFLLVGLLIGVYGLFLTFLPSQGERGKLHRFRSLALAMSAVALAGGVGAFQILETRRAHGLSIRRELDFETFAQGSAPPLDALKSAAVPYFVTISDVTAYVPPLTLGLGVLYFVLSGRKDRDPRAVFWLAMALVSWVLMFGANTPLHRLLHHVPPFNFFRVPSRHSAEWTFAASVLGAYGWDAVAVRIPQVRAATRNRVLQITATSALLVGIGVSAWWIASVRDDRVAAYVAAKAFVSFASLACVLAAFSLGSAYIRGFLLAAAIPLACVTEPYICVAKWWFPYTKTREQLLTPSQMTTVLAKALSRHGRVYSYLVAFEEQQQTRPRFDAPNRSGWFGLDDVGGYEPLILARYSRALGDVDLFAVALDRQPHAELGAPFNPRSRVLDLLSTEFVVRRVADDQVSIPSEWTHASVLDRLVLDFGEAAVQRFLQGGWSGNEVLGSRSGVWSDGRRSRVVVPLLPVDTAYVLTFVAGTFGPAVPFKMRVLVNGERVGDLAINAGWQERSLVIAKGLLVEGSNRIEFRYSKTAAPAKTIPGATDRRELALFVDELAVTPAF